MDDVSVKTYKTKSSFTFAIYPTKLINIFHLTY